MAANISIHCSNAVHGDILEGTIFITSSNRTCLEAAESYRISTRGGKTTALQLFRTIEDAFQFVESRVR